jgi:outer membrane protein OmpA-like peptidoglycan-associated protein
MSRYLARRPGTWICAGLLIAGAVAGCGGVTAVQPSSQCGWTSPGSADSQPTSGVASSRIVLIDASASFWPSRGSMSLPDDAEGTAQSYLVSDFGLSGTRLVSVGVFDGSSATIDWELGNAALPPATGSNQEVPVEQADARRCFGAVISKALSTPPQTPGSDLMGALGAAGSQLGAVPASRSHVLLITDGLSNTGCLNFSKVVRDGQSAAQIVHSCTVESGLAWLRGTDLQLSGISFPAYKPALSTSEQNFLEDYWREVCAALGVRLAQNCVTPPTGFSQRVSTASRLSDPRVSFAPPLHGDKIPVPTPLLFAFDSAVLTPAAQSYLGILVQEIRSSGHTVTEIVGHTDRVGSAAYNLRLSKLRALAVRAYLAQSGFTGITARGVGFSQPACEPEYTSSGQPIEACMARDRRVDIILGR